MSKLGDVVRTVLNRPRAAGGLIQGPAPSDDSVRAVLSPGYVSHDRGETWHETDSAARRRRMAELQHDPTPEAGEEFWKLAAPDIEAGFWAARRETHERHPFRS